MAETPSGACDRNAGTATLCSLAVSQTLAESRACEGGMDDTDEGPQSAVSEVEQCTQHCKPATSPHLCECLHLATDGHIKWMEQMRRQIEILGRRPSTCGAASSRRSMWIGSLEPKG